MKGSTKPERMDDPSALNPTTEVIKVFVCSMSLEEMPADVKALEERIVEKVQQSRREFYAAILYAFQRRWLQERGDYTAVRWHTIDQVTPFGLMRLPPRVVRVRGAEKGGYLTLSKALLKPKAPRLLSPWIEKRALEQPLASTIGRRQACWPGRTVGVCSENFRTFFGTSTPVSGE